MSSLCSFTLQPMFQSVRLSCETRTLDRGQHDVDAVCCHSSATKHMYTASVQCSQYDLLASRRVTLELDPYLYIKKMRRKCLTALTPVHMETTAHRFEL